MNDSFQNSRHAIEQARLALRNGDRTTARQWAEKAAQLDPQSEDPWLVLAAVASPKASMDYIQKALAINPESPRARKGMEWAMQRLQETQPSAPVVNDDPIARLRQSMKTESVESTAPNRPRTVEETQPKARVQKQDEGPESEKEAKPRRRLWVPLLLVALACLVVALVGYSAISNPALAAVLSRGNAPQASAPKDAAPNWAKAEIAKPTYTAVMDMPVAAAFTATSTVPPLPTKTQPPAPTLMPETTSTPEATATVETALAMEPSATPAVTETPGVMEAVIVPDTPTSEYVQPAEDEVAVSNDPGTSFSGRWIDVNLTQQRLYAYEGDSAVNSFIVSTGTWQTPTVTGTYKVWIKLASTTMSGPGYYLTNVPYTMYFYGDYGIHGTYWHNNFGTPMSHGCVNMRTSDAEWLYNWASVGTVVHVHY